MRRPLLAGSVIFSLALAVAAAPRGETEARPARPTAAAPRIPQAANTVTNVLVNDPSGDSGTHQTQSTTAVVVGSRGRVVVAFDDSGSYDANGTQFTGFARSIDGGASFADGGELPTAAGGDAGTPAMARDNVSRRVYLATLPFSGAGLKVFRSDDDFATVLPPVNAAVGFTAKDHASAPSLAVDNFPGAGVGDVYLAVTNFSEGGAGSNPSGIYLFRSNSGGASWGAVGGSLADSLIAPAGAGSVNGSCVVVMPDHTVVVFWLDQSGGTGTANTIKVRRATEFGAVFGSVVNVTGLASTAANGSLGSVGGFRTNSFPQAAANPANSELYVVYNDAGATGDPGDVWYRRSFDGGATWTARVRVSDDVLDRLQWSPSIAVTPDGSRTGVFWYDRRSNGLQIERWGAIGLPFANAFPTNFLVSDASFPAVFAADPLVSPTYMGDYDHAAADNRYFYTAWGDNRLVPSAPDVRLAKVPVARNLPHALVVDGSAGSSSDGNGVFEPGEQVAVEPSRDNLASSGFSLNGTITFYGSPNAFPANYVIADGSASYGLLPAGGTASCADTGNCYSLYVSSPPNRPTHFDALFVEKTSDGDSREWKLHYGDSFTDVPRSSPFYRKIETALHHGITVGCTTTTYCPGQNVLRSQMASFLARALSGGNLFLKTAGFVDGQVYICGPLGGISLFTDVAPEASFCRAAHYLASQNVTKGCGVSLYCPDQNVSRAEMAIFVARAMVAPEGGAAVPLTYGPDPVTGRSYSCAAGSPAIHFTDVPAADPSCKSVHFLWAKNVVGGCSATQYCPGGPVTRDQMAKFLTNALSVELYGP